MFIKNSLISVILLKIRFIDFLSLFYRIFFIVCQPIIIIVTSFYPIRILSLVSSFIIFLFRENWRLIMCINKQLFIKVEALVLVKCVVEKMVYCTLSSISLQWNCTIVIIAKPFRNFNCFFSCIFVSFYFLNFFFLVYLFMYIYSLSSKQYDIFQIRSQ